VGGQKLVWPLFSRSQCRLCHSSWSEFALGFQTEQLNGPGPGGRNQLVALTELGLINRLRADANPLRLRSFRYGGGADRGVAANDKRLPPFDSESAAEELKLADPNDASQPLEARARAYLHANCGHCHANGAGGAVELRLHAYRRDAARIPVSVAEMKAVGVPPSRGNFALPDACIIKPGDPLTSTLYFRMAKFGRDRMPHLGSERLDEEGLKLIEQWIASLSGGAAATEPIVDDQTPERIFADPKAALSAARRIGQNQTTAAQRDALLTSAAKLPAGPVRDLFEGYLPADEKGRKLGSSPRPASILSLLGDVSHGKNLFWSTAVNCGSCHKIGEKGIAIGPDLSTIGKVRPREDLLESILEPSRRIEPKYAAYAVYTKDGRVITGLVIERDEKKVVVRDGQNKENVIAAENVEELRPSRISLMPEGQMAGLTAQEAADLLEYLARRK